jgi:RNA polymerase sigma factor (sigma-70 family)
MDDLIQVVRRAQSGDKAAFNSLVLRFQDMAVGYAYSHLKDFHMSQDVAQEAFVGAFYDLPKLRSPEAFPRWFRSVVYKHCDRVTRRKAGKMLPIEDAAIVTGVSDPLSELEKRETDQQVIDAVNGLPEQERQAITLFYIGEHTHAEIASFLNLSEATVNNRLRSARKRLKKGLLSMTRETLKNQAPSSGRTFADKIDQMIKPVSLRTTKHFDRGNAKGEDIWEMVCVCLKGDIEAIKSLVAQDPNLVCCEYNYTQPIHFAVREGNTDVVRYLLEQGADPTYRTYEFKDTLVTLARDRGHQDIVAVLEAEIKKKNVGYDADKEEQANEWIEAVQEKKYGRVAELIQATPENINLTKSDGLTALHAAVLIGNFYLVKKLVESGADVNAQGGSGSRSGWKPIHIALFARRRHDPDLYAIRDLIVGYLLGKGCEYNIMIASATGDVQMVRTLLEADPKQANFRDTCNRMPISVATQGGHARIVDLLLSHGADPNAYEPHAPRGCALLSATYNGHVDVAFALLKHGADPNGIVDSTGSAVRYARQYPELHQEMLNAGGKDVDEFLDAIKEDDLKKVEEMLEADPDRALDEFGFWGEGILVLPAQRAQMEMIDLLMGYGATVPLVSKWGPSYYFKHLHVARHLLEKGADPNHRDWLGLTVMHKFAARGDREKAELVLEFGADVHARDTECCTTPLGIAARQGQKDMVGFLLEQGAKPNLPDDESWATPLAWAERRGHAEIVDVLKNHGAKG